MIDVCFPGMYPPVLELNDEVVTAKRAAERDEIGKLSAPSLLTKKSQFVCLSLDLGSDLVACPESLTVKPTTGTGVLVVRLDVGSKERGPAPLATRSYAQRGQPP